MGLSEGDISKAVQAGSVDLCVKHLFTVAEELEKQSEALRARLAPVLRERNPEIEDDKVPILAATVPVSGNCALAVELVTTIQKLRTVGVQNETLLRNLDL